MQHVFRCNDCGKERVTRMSWSHVAVRCGSCARHRRMQRERVIRLLPIIHGIAGLLTRVQELVVNGGGVRDSELANELTRLTAAYQDAVDDWQADLLVRGRSHPAKTQVAS